MDPALWELLRGDTGNGDREVEAIIRLDRPRVDVAGVRIVARFGHVATCRVRRDSIVRTWHDDNVLSIKCPRSVLPEPVWHDDATIDATIGRPNRVLADDRRRPTNIAVTGAGVVVGVVDWGCDFDHPNFKHADGSTRLLGLWDQRGRSTDVSPRPYGYGRAYLRSDIDHALRSSAPYDALGYHPADADRDRLGAHGTHVLDIAAGNGRAGGPVGIAPRADLVFVHLADRGTTGLANLGDSARILEAVDFIRRIAGRRPWVINLSVGRHGGPHDGSTLAEQALDHAVASTPGRFIVQSAGNYFERSTHASGYIMPNGVRSLTFVTDPADLTPNELEVWYPGGDDLAVAIESPTGLRTPWIPLGHESRMVENGGLVGRLYHRRRDPNNGDNHIDLFLRPWAPPGAWTLNLRAGSSVTGPFHAWLERDESCGACQARFVSTDVDHLATTGTIANGREPFVVGAYDAHSSTRTVAPFSSSGPTRDGRPKPDCVAPGVQVLAARSAPRGSTRSPGMLVRKSGTSMATPHVTGAVALCLERTPQLSAAALRALLRDSAERTDGRHHSRVGAGYLDVAALVAADFARDGVARRQVTPLPPQDPRHRHGSKEHAMQAQPPLPSHTTMRPDALYRAMVYGTDPARGEPDDDPYIVVARPGEEPLMAPAPGDLLVRIALGEPGLGHVAVLASSMLVPWQSLDAIGVASESEGPGSYATVVEDGPFPHGPDDMFARRVLDRYGRMPPGQLLLRPLGEPAVSAVPEHAPGDDEPAEQQPVSINGPLTNGEWAQVEMWQSAGEVGTDRLTDNAGANASIVANAIFCGRRIGRPDTNDHPLLCVDPNVTSAEPAVAALRRHVVARGDIVNWSSVSVQARRVLAMELLIDTHGYPVDAAAGIVGNVDKESAVLPNRIEGSRPATPMRAPNSAGLNTDFTADEVMNRNRAASRGPRLAGIGLAQWTTANRRAGLFAHRHGVRPPGAGILFDLPAQIDYLVTELRTLFPAVETLLRGQVVTLNDAADEFVYEVERPGSIISNGVRLPRAHPAVQTVFRDRRARARRALNDYRAVHPVAVPPAGAGSSTADEYEASFGDEYDSWNDGADTESFIETLPGLWLFFAGPPLQVGSVGDGVVVLQTALNRLGNTLSVSGTFDTATHDAVRAFQASNGLCPAGIASAQTKWAIYRAASRLENPAADPLPEAIVRVAQSQLPRWRQGAGYLQETDPAATSILQEYYRDGVCRSVPAADLQNPAWHNHNYWSSVFVSWVMRTAGAGVDFAYSTAHRVYVRAARQNRCANNTANPFWAYRATEVAPQLGDIVCRSRANPLATYNNIMQPIDWALHCDIVTGAVAGANTIRVTGGNVAVPGGPNHGRTVAERPLRVDAAGMLDLTGDQSRIFAVIRCRGQAPGVVQPC